MSKMLLVLGLVLSGCASPQWSAVVALKESAPGRFEEGGCRLYATSLQKALPFKTTRISWTATGIDPFAKSARHEVLAYEVGNEVWFMDNFSTAPKWVGPVGERPEVLAMQFYSPAWVVISNVVVE